MTTVIGILILERLSNREIDVLLLLAERLSNKEIAERFFVSPDTVKKHTINIYRKLGVNDRRQAVVTARTLGILPLKCSVFIISGFTYPIISPFWSISFGA
jgi:ATP/maltotriose-dependent transcriptional regulator MalT